MYFRTLFFLFATAILASGQVIVQYTDSWKYLAPSSDPGTAWRGLGYNDSSWNSGSGLLGFDGDFPACCPAVPNVQTTIGAPGNGLTTYLFRKTFTFSGNPANATFVIDQIVDDGVTYYLNGNLLGSVRHTPGAWDNVASSGIGNAAEEIAVLSGPATGLVNGTNVLAAEVHNNGVGGSDVVFGARIRVANAPPIRILPLGDSITFGQGEAGGYRLRLFQLLSAAGYNVDFLGSDRRNSSLQLPDYDQEGHPGWRINTLDSNVPSYFAQMEYPDIILLHVGTNDFGFNQENLDITKAINRLDAMIERICTLRPMSRVIVTNLLQRVDSYDSQIQTHFNPYVAPMVAAHAALGRRVTFLNMRSALTTGDLADGLHPNAAGYNKMADAWFAAIQGLVGVNGDSLAPAIAEVQIADTTHVVVTFSKPVEDAAATAGNFAINPGISISAASLDAAKRKVTLTTSSLVAGQTYILSAGNVRDRTSPQHTIAAGSTFTFNGPAPSGIIRSIPEAANYRLVYSLNIPNTAAFNSSAPSYSVDNRSSAGAFNRIAYYLELQKPGQPLQYCWVSMDAFTNDASRIGVPCASTGAVFQQDAGNLRYVSNVIGTSQIPNTNGLLEFWPTDYSADDSNYWYWAASGSICDSGDTRSGSGNYGSMQVHVAGSRLNVFAYNRWGDSLATPGDLGIGNNPNSLHKDWTFAVNADSYSVKTLQVYVRPAQEFPLSLRSQRRGNAIDLTFAGVANGVYRVERATDLSNPTVWSNLGSVTATTGGDVFYTDGSIPSARAYYRLVRTSP